jgi:hypothetical protein
VSPVASYSVDIKFLYGLGNQVLSIGPKLSQVTALRYSTLCNALAVSRSTHITTLDSFAASNRANARVLALICQQCALNIPHAHRRSQLRQLYRRSWLRNDFFVLHVSAFATYSTKVKVKVILAQATKAHR